jgi:drug/metabolite transporter (DMT)-like permease
MNPILAIIIANIIWGAASPIFKFALTNIPPFTLAFCRFFFAALFFLPFVKKYWKKISLKDYFELFLIAFFGITVNITFFFLGLQKTTSINAPIISSAGPVFIYILSVLFLHEQKNMKVFNGMMIALIGVFAIIFSPVFLDGKGINFGEIQGNVFLFIAMIGSVLNVVIGKRVMREVNPYQVTFLSFVFGAIPFIPFMLRELQHWSFSQLDVRGWTGIIFGVIFSSAIAYFFHYYAMSKIKAQEIGLFTYIDPVIAVFIAVPLLKEYPNLFFFIGSLLVFGGIYLAEGRIHWHPFHKLKNHTILRSI